MGLPSTLANEGDGAGDELQLVVVEQDSVTVHNLPAHGQVLVGRATEADVSLADPGASAQHARIYVEGRAVAIEDLGSRNGTQVRGQRIAVASVTGSLRNRRTSGASRCGCGKTTVLVMRSTF